MKIRITSVDSQGSSVEFEGLLSEWFAVLRDNCGAEEQTGSTEEQIIYELLDEGKFIFAGFVGAYYTVEVTEILAAQGANR